jgi:hypothetical protein
MVCKSQHTAISRTFHIKHPTDHTISTSCDLNKIMDVTNSNVYSVALFNDNKQIHVDGTLVSNNKQSVRN